MRLLALLSVSLLPILICAQVGDATVSGRVLDSETSEPVAFATVTIVVGGETVIGVLTSEDGRFVVSGLPEGSYRVRVEFLGYEPMDTRLLVGSLNDIYDLGDIELEQGNALEEVIATARQQILGAT